MHVILIITIPLLTFFLSLEAASAKFEADMTFEGPAVEAVPRLGTDIVG